MATDDLASEHRRTSSQVWLLLGAAGIAGLVVLLRPFLIPLAMAAVIAVLVYPVHAWCTERIGREGTMAFLVALGVVLLVFLPAVGLTVGLLAALESSFHEGAASVGSDAWAQLTASETLQNAAALMGIEAEELPARIGAKLREQAGPIAGQSLRLVSGFGGGLFDLGIILFSMFFLLRDGPHFVNRLVRFSPVDRARTMKILGTARDAIFATVYGNLGVAAVQGTLGGLAFSVLGLPSAVFWGVVMAILSMAPLVGAAVVWLPASLILLVQGDWVRGLILLAFGAVVISSVDNFVRAFIVGGRTELHPLAVFLSVLGGIALFGAAGVFLGPVLFVVSISMIEMTRVALDAEATPGGLLVAAEPEKAE